MDDLFNTLMDDLVKRGLVTVRLQEGFKPFYSLTPEGEKLADDWEYIDSPEFQDFLDKAEEYLKTLC